MKKFTISEKCNACGRCVIMTDLLVENGEGKAEPAISGYIADDFLSEAQNIVEFCPVKALSIIEAGNVKSSGREGLKELKIVLQNKLKEVDVPVVMKDDVKFDANNYTIDYAGQKSGYEYKYSSESQAEKAALDEFNRMCYSQYRPFILSVFVKYKNDKLKPFYTFEANENSFYYKTNQKYENVLKEVTAEAKALTDGKIALPQNFNTFEVYPGDSFEFDKERIYARLKNFETRSTSSGIMAEFNSGSYSSIDSYKMYIDTENMEINDGEGLFGKSKYKTKYCYGRIYKAANEYIKDLKSAMNLVNIDEDTLYDVNQAIINYKEELQKVIEKKNKEFSEAINTI